MDKEKFPVFLVDWKLLAAAEHLATAYPWRTAWSAYTQSPQAAKSCPWAG